MKPLVSVIIPTRNSAPFLARCLSSIKNQSYKKCEVVVVDNSSTDKTIKIAQRFTKNVFNKGLERSAQRNFGAKKSKGKYIFFVDSDMEVSKNVIEECVMKMASNTGLQALIIPEKSKGTGFWAECKALERIFYEKVEWIEAARFFERTIFNTLNGYDEGNTGTEDFDLPQRLIYLKGVKSIERVKSYITHNEKKIIFSQLLSKKFYYGKSIHIYQKRNSENVKKQSNIFARYALFFFHPKILFKNPVIGLGMLFMKGCEFAALGLGYLVSFAPYLSSR